MRLALPVGVMLLASAPRTARADGELGPLIGPVLIDVDPVDLASAGFV